MVYFKEIISKETIEELATNCFENGTSAEVGWDYCPEDNAGYYTIFINDMRELTFMDSDRADEIAKEINDYARLIKNGEALPQKKYKQYSERYEESENDPFDINGYRLITLTEDDLPI
ncbi:hypothetical protein SFC65_19720 [Priestia filamentosa]|uniref:hypothetical protein n=1 Tax=Priestia filamentosa TaxID=1402861 RepID=UPI003982AE2E